MLHLGIMCGRCLNNDFLFNTLNNKKPQNMAKDHLPTFHWILVNKHKA